MAREVNTRTVGQRVKTHDARGVRHLLWRLRRGDHVYEARAHIAPSGPLLRVGIDVTSARHVVGAEKQRAINTSDWGTE